MIAIGVMISRSSFECYRDGQWGVLMVFDKQTSDVLSRSGRSGVKVVFPALYFALQSCSPTALQCWLACRPTCPARNVCLSGTPADWLTGRPLGLADRAPRLACARPPPGTRFQACLTKRYYGGPSAHRATSRLRMSSLSPWRVKHGFLP